jgi:CheY-like chemotaxis protein
VIRVKDDGIGISAPALPRLFDFFMQEDSSIDRTSGGLGIGLTLVRHLVELHGGSVEAQSAGPGQGSEFSVRMLAKPDRPRGAPPAAPSRPAESSSVSRRVLVTDDNVDGAETLAIVLRLVGHHVRVAHSGPDALEIAAAFRPEVIFLDIGMPGMDGFETARRLRGLGGIEQTVLVAVTGYGQESDRQRAREAGFDEFLVKPASPEAVRTLSLKARLPTTAPEPAAES